MFFDFNCISLVPLLFACVNTVQNNIMLTGIMLNGNMKISKERVNEKVSIG